MNRFAEERCEAVRLALRIARFPSPGDVYRLVDWLADCIVVETDPGARLASCLHQDGRAHITLPDRLEERQVTMALVEEIGHYLCTVGAATMFWSARADSDEEARRLRRLGKVWDMVEERQVRDFCQAWFLPSVLIREATCWDELIWESNCAPQMVGERRRKLRGESFALSGPPQWSAGRVYSVRHVAGGLNRFIQVGGAAGGRRYDLPVTDRTLSDVRGQVNADLWALTPTEFEIKYAGAEYVTGTLATLDSGQLYAWAGGVA